MVLLGTSSSTRIAVEVILLVAALRLDVTVINRLATLNSHGVVVVVPFVALRGR